MLVKFKLSSIFKQSNSTLRFSIFCLGLNFTRKLFVRRSGSYEVTLVGARFHASYFKSSYYPI